MDESDQRHPKRCLSQLYYTKIKASKFYVFLHRKSHVEQIGHLKADPSLVLRVRVYTLRKESLDSWGVKKLGFPKNKATKPRAIVTPESLSKHVQMQALELSNPTLAASFLNVSV